LRLEGTKNGVRVH